MFEALDLAASSFIQYGFAAGECLARPMSAATKVNAAEEQGKIGLDAGIRTAH